MKHLLYPLIFLILLLPVSGSGSKLEKGFEALRIYDYFLAKKLFTEIQAKKPDAYASYGLSVIFSRNDNPFSNVDSAGKYIRLSYHVFHTYPQMLAFPGFTIQQSSILALADTISAKMFQKIKNLNTIGSYEFFLNNFYLANRNTIKEAVYLRDEIEYKNVLMSNTSDATLEFIRTHPQSDFFQEALALEDRQIYEELTVSKTAEAYIYFIRKHPENIMVNTALEKLFAIYVQSNDVKGLASFVRNYPKAHQTIEAWKLLFSLSVKEFSFSEVERFIAIYPEFPLKNSILNELELNKLVLFPYQQGDFSGFIDNKGKFVIKPVYDAATDFHEGLSVVSKNDSVFFINKKNIDPFNKIYSDALVFRNGIAPVKENGNWYFINRQGQSISTFYDEINELSEEIYVVKSGDKYGALDHFGQVVIEPKFDKLGDFKNGFAYYLENGSFGFISKSGATHKAEFDWISDFNPEKIAIFQKGNKYGLVNSFGTKILEANYDQIIKTNSSVFIIISGVQYGFFSSADCFLSPITYDFMKEKSPEYYTNGSLLRLIKKGEQAFVDENGRLNINFGAFQEINFACNDLIRVKQKNKYGYLDRKLNPVIPYKYSSAGDFSDSLALVKLKDQNILLNNLGAEVFSSSAEISKVSKHYFLVNDEMRSLVNKFGEPVFTDVETIQKVNDSLYLITLNNGEIKLLYD